MLRPTVLGLAVLLWPAYHARSAEPPRRVWDAGQRDFVIARGEAAVLDPSPVPLNGRLEAGLRAVESELQSLCRSHFDAMGVAERVRAWELLARVAAWRGDAAAAAGYLRRMVAAAGDAQLAKPLVMADGRLLTDTAGRLVETRTRSVEVLDDLADSEALARLADMRLLSPNLRRWPWGMKRLRAFAPEDPARAVPGVARLLWCGERGEAWDRADRVVYATKSGQLVCRSAPHGEELWSVAEPLAGTEYAAWPRDGSVVVWGRAGAAKVSGAGRVEWVRSAGELAAGRAPATRPAGPSPAGPATAPATAPAEELETLLPLRDRLIVGTSSGAFAAVGLKGGNVLWGLREEGALPGSVRASEGFVAVGALRDGGRRHVLAVRAIDGAVAVRLEGQGDPNGGPLGFAISPHGVAVVHSGDRLSAWDLLGECKTPMWSAPAAWAGRDGRERHWPAVERGIVLSVSGGQRVALRRHDLSTGKELSAMGRLAWPVSPRMVAAGGRACVWSSTRVLLAGLEGGPGTEGALVPFAGDAVDLFLTRDYAVRHDVVEAGLADGAADQAAGPDGRLHRLLPYWRALVTSREGIEQESGLLVDVHYLNEPSGVTRVRAVEGGVCYLAGDGKLHWLKGNRVTRDD